MKKPKRRIGDIMKLLIASDIHGDIESAKILIEAFHKNECDKIVLLGDILYHGPRNDLPGRYAPKEVITLLNGYSDKILAVRGNCDTEVDQMVLEFPILADYAVIPLPKGNLAYLTHGHRFHEEAPMPMGAEDVLLHGHTHVAGKTACAGGQVCLNPGSVSMPKGGTPHGYMTLENGVFEIKCLADRSLYLRFKA